MINYNENIFATYEIKDYQVNVVADKDDEGNQIETDVMPYFVRGDLTYLYNVNFRVYNSSSEVKVKINGIEFTGNGRSNSFSIENVLVKSFTVDKDCTIEISYCL